MKKLLIIGFYELKDHLINIKENFEKYHYNVISYPLFRWAYDANDKIENYKEHLHNFLKKEKPNVILWWFFDVPLDVFKFIKMHHPQIYYIIYNSDDPMNINTETLEKCKIFDQVVTACKHNITKYKLYSGVKNVTFNPPGFNPMYFHPFSSDEIEMYDSELDKYTCDISIYCFQLYTDPYFGAQWIPRKQLLDDVSDYAKSHNKVFKIFGPSSLKEFYPDHYVEDPPYINVIKIYNCSKINIVTHPICNKTLSVGMDEMRIMGSGGVMFIDNIKGMDEIFKDGYNCVVMKQTCYIKQVEKILNIYNTLKIDTIKKNAKATADNYTWSNWTKKIHINISKTLFSKATYKVLYGDTMPKDVVDYWQYWLDVGVDDGQICYEFDVPKEFCADDYAQIMSIKSNDPKILYYHWYMNGKNPDYISEDCTRRGSMINAEKMNVTMGNLFAVLATLDKIDSFGKIDDGLDELHVLAKNNPRLKVDEILDYYLGTVC